VRVLKGTGRGFDLLFGDHLLENQDVDRTYAGNQILDAGFHFRRSAFGAADIPCDKPLLLSMRSRNG